MGERGDAPGRVRSFFERAGYTVAGVRELLGPVAGGALARDEIVPALRAASGGSPLEAAVRLCWLQVPVPESAIPEADALVALGLAERAGGELRPLLHVEPLEGTDGGHLGHVVSDLKVRPGDGSALRPDHVVGSGGASAGLAQLAIHSPVDNALDLGTGCGVQVLHLRGRAARLTATDLNPRALRLARMSFALSGLDGVELLEGSLYEPVRDRRFDLIVANPPFVISPGGGLVYRESGLPGDDVCRRLVTGAADRLNAGGWCQLLANWLHIDGMPWQERVAGWVPAGCDAWVVQRDVQDPAEYAELWLRDSCEVGTPEYAARYEAWLDYFERQRVTGVGFGWITLRNSGADHPVVRVEEIRHAVEQPVGAYVARILDGLTAGPRFSTGCPQGLRTAEGVVQEQIGPPGAEDPERIVLRQRDGLRRAAGVGTVEAALAGVCDGSFPLPPLLDAIAELMDLPREQVHAHADAVLPELIADGFFEVI
ncbi:Methyltransferase small domain-containing protein [Thermomonospora echinospora]|uniref:Methyltransferase small domain-containing protein n=1 Tax=Thermomonospora echinospora TaxID=1992 RepID=A0A1H6CLD7_9ACTN|nr:methyltransferase [Thermomonospora echinospora]SEG73236.1 Methyltransferase small domain-containing protein [Thermomonospora echinospora]